MGKMSRYPSEHGTTGTNSRDGHNLGTPQSSERVHPVKSELTSSTTTSPHNPPLSTGPGQGGR